MPAIFIIFASSRMLALPLCCICLEEVLGHDPCFCVCASQMGLVTAWWPQDIPADMFDPDLITTPQIHSTASEEALRGMHVCVTGAIDLVWDFSNLVIIGCSICLEGCALSEGTSTLKPDHFKLYDTVSEQRLYSREHAALTGCLKQHYHHLL